MIDEVQVASSPALPAWRGPRKHLRISLALWIGALMLGALVFAAAFAPQLTRYDPIKTDLVNGLQPPSAAHLLGTDNFGRDILTRLLYGARVDLQIGIVPTAAAFLLGLVIGALSFLGLGVQPPTPEWGLMIAEGRDFLLTSPAMVLFPGLALLWVGVTFNVLGDLLTDRLRPGG